MALAQQHLLPALPNIMMMRQYRSTAFRHVKVQAKACFMQEARDEHLEYEVHSLIKFVRAAENLPTRRFDTFVNLASDDVIISSMSPSLLKLA